MNFFDYHLWANKKVYQHLKEQPKEVIFQEVQSVFPTLYDTLFHIYQTDFVWLGVIREEGFEKIMAGVGQIKEEHSDRNFEKLENRHLELSLQYENFIKSLADLNASITVQHRSYGELSTSYSELLQHVANHGTYHRGNITAILRQLGYKGIPTDYVFYLYEKREV